MPRSYHGALLGLALCLFLPSYLYSDDGTVINCPAISDWPTFVEVGSIGRDGGLDGELLGPTHRSMIQQFLLRLDSEAIEISDATPSMLSELVTSAAKESSQDATGEGCIRLDYINSGLLSRWQSIEEATHGAEIIVSGTIDDVMVGFSGGTPGHKVDIRVGSILKGHENRETLTYFSPGADFSLWETRFCSKINESNLNPKIGDTILVFYTPHPIDIDCGLMQKPRAVVIELDLVLDQAKGDGGKLDESIGRKTASEVLSYVKTYQGARVSSLPTVPRPILPFQMLPNLRFVHPHGLELAAHEEGRLVGVVG